jgi:hypothetical protein
VAAPEAERAAAEAERDLEGALASKELYKKKLNSELI